MNTDKGKTDQPLSCFPDDVSSHLPGVRFTPVGNKNSFLGRKTVAFCSPLDRKTLECSAEELNTCILSNGNGWISALDEAGLTPLHRFSRSNHVEIVRTLLELGGEVNVRGFGDMTPLHLASRFVSQCKGDLGSNLSRDNLGCCWVRMIQSSFHDDYSFRSFKSLFNLFQTAL